MSRIYRQAKTVQIWLGGHDNDFGVFSSVMNSLESVNFSEWKVYTSFEILHERSYEKRNLPCVTPNTWFQALEFLCRSWFHRSWIIQEVTFASQARLFCGLSATDLGVLSAFGNFLDESGWFSQIIKDPRAKQLKTPPFRLFPAAILTVKYHLGTGSFEKCEAGWGEPLSLVQNVQMFRLTRATNARDKIYAFVNLPKESLGSLPHESVPRYDHSTTEVYTRAAICMLRSGQRSLDLFSLREDDTLMLFKFLPS